VVLTGVQLMHATLKDGCYRQKLSSLTLDIIFTQLSEIDEKKKKKKR